MNIALGFLETRHQTKVNSQLASPERDRRESIFRLTVANFLAVILLVGFFGTGWDIEWHLQVGRDSAFSPPHLLIYSVLGVSGITAILVVLSQTYRYWRGSPTVTNSTTTPVLGLFRAPLGFSAAGFALLAMVIAAPLDDYWHQLYGIDVSLWSPFHMMGVIASSLVQTGLMLALASEYNRNQTRYAQTSQATDRRLSWLALAGLALTGATLLGKLTLIATPAAVGLSLTPLQIPLYALILASLQPLVLVAVVVATRRIGVASLTGLFFALLQAGIVIGVPWAVNGQMASEGLQLRADNPATLLNLHTLATALPGWLPLAALLVDVVLLVSLKIRNQASNLRVALPSHSIQLPLILLAGGVAGVALAYFNQPYEIVQLRASQVATQFSVRAEALPDWLPRLLEFNPNVWAALPLAFLLGGMSAWLGYHLGLIMRYLSR